MLNVCQITPHCGELGPVDKPGPESKAAERDEAKEAACGLVIAGSDPALFLEVADEALNA